MSSVLVEPVGSQPQTSRMSVSRATTVPAAPTSTRSRSNSLAVRCSSALALERAVRGDVDAHVLRVQLVLVARVADAAAQQRPDAGEQLGEAERLGHVVVGTGVEPDDRSTSSARAVSTSSGVVQAEVADGAGDVEAVHVRQAEVEHDEVGAAAAPSIAP